MADSQGTRLQLLYLHGALHIVDIVTFPRQSRDGAAVSVALSHTSDASGTAVPCYTCGPPLTLDSIVSAKRLLAE